MSQTLDFDATPEEVLARIEAVILDILSALAEGQLPVLEVVSLARKQGALFIPEVPALAGSIVYNTRLCATTQPSSQSKALAGCLGRYSCKR